MIRGNVAPAEVIRGNLAAPSIRGNVAGQKCQLATSLTSVIIAKIRQIENILKSKNVSLLVVRQLEAMASPLQVGIPPDLSR